MPIEINQLNASARLGAAAAESRLTEAEIDLIVQRVIQTLERRERLAKMARPDASARSLLDRA